MVGMTRDTAALRLLVLPGDGIGREVIPAALAVLNATGLPLELHEGEAGWDCFQRHGVALPEATLAAAREVDAVLFGAVASPSHPVPGYRSPIVALRRALDLYANIRPTTSSEQIASGSPVSALAGRGAAVDLVVVRENTECLYVGQEQSDGETATATRLITRRASERIARFAFELARQRAAGSSGQVPGRPRVTIVHKANVLRETCGLFRTAALHVAEAYPEVTAGELLVDTAALQLVQRPERFDVLVTTNMFGDILSDVASYWSGGLGLASSANIGDTHALFEPVHGAAPDIAGKGIANPLAAIGCVAMLLEHLAQTRSNTLSAAPHSLALDWGGWAGRVRAAMRAVLASEVRTPDLGGRASTADVTRAVIEAL
ncbi:MAG: isocitrate/isopropylmalate dehydrogenase family protein [Roseiflexaceae bacterium]